MSSPPRRWVIHLPVVAPDLPRASLLARTAARALAYLRIDAGETTVSTEDHQQVRHRVFCHRLLDNGRHCVLRHGHSTDCTPRIRR